MKDFLIIGNMNACTYKEVFPLFKSNLKISGVKGYTYTTPEGETKKFGNICWFTTLQIKPVEPPVLSKLYNPTLYKRYDNYNAINVDKVKDIPIDYDGVMGVPITIVDKICSDGFIHFDTPSLENTDSKYRIIDGLNRYTILDMENKNEWARKNHKHLTSINGKPKYFRILIQKVK